MPKKKNPDPIKQAIADKLDSEFDSSFEGPPVIGTEIDLRGFFDKKGNCIICRANAATKTNTITPGNTYEFRHGEVCKKHFYEATHTPLVQCIILAKTNLGEEIALNPTPKSKGN